MSNVNFIGKGGDKFIAPSGQIGGHPVFPGGERGEDEHSATGDGDGPLGRQACQHRSGRAQNYRGISAQEDLQTFPLHGRVKAADNTVPGVTPFGGLIVSWENDLAGTTSGTE